MTRCVACDYCDTTGEMSAYKWGLAIPNYTGGFVTDPNTGEEYCRTCYIPEGEMYDFEEWPLGTMGNTGMVEVVPRRESSDKEPDNESGS